MIQSAEEVIQDIHKVINDPEKSQSVKLILVNEIINRYNFWKEKPRTTEEDLTKMFDLDGAINEYFKK